MKSLSKALVKLSLKRTTSFCNYIPQKKLSKQQIKKKHKTKVQEKNLMTKVKNANFPFDESKLPSL